MAPPKVAVRFPITSDPIFVGDSILFWHQCLHRFLQSSNVSVLSLVKESDDELIFLLSGESPFTQHFRKKCTSNYMVILIRFALTFLWFVVECGQKGHGRGQLDERAISVCFCCLRMISKLEVTS